MSERPEDRGPLDFDLGDEEPRGRARPAAAADASPPRSPLATAARPGGAYVWVVGVAAVVLVLVLVVGTARQGTGRGARGVADGAVIPPFAVPLARSTLVGDANLATKPGQGQAGDRPACAVRGPRVLNGCALRERGPFVLAFFTAGSGRCIAELDAMERVRARVPGVQFAAVAIRGDRGALQALVRTHGWRFPVGWDRDGALANAYHVQVCPQLTFARRGGRVAETTFGAVGAAQLTAKVQRLLRG